MATSDQLTDRLRELHRSLYAVPEVSEPPKSILRIFGSTRSEQQRKYPTGILSDPTQPHGFGADLLKAFLDTAHQESGMAVEYYHRDIQTVRVET